MAKLIGLETIITIAMMTYDLLFKSLECLSSKLSWQIEEIKRLKKKLIRNDIGCTGKIKTSLTFVFLSFLTQWPTLLFFHFTLFSVYINTMDELNRLTNVGNLWEIRTRTQKIKLSKRDKWLLKKGKSDFLEKIPSLKRLCFTYLTTDLKGTTNT